MKKHLFVLLLSLTSIATTGCAVIKGAPETTVSTFTELGKWKGQASKLTNNSGYEGVRTDVNSWLEAKAKEVEIAAPQYFTQVDLTRPVDLTNEVNSFIGMQPAGITEDVLDWIAGEYKKGRKAEGEATSKGLRDYKWPEKK